MAYSTKLCTAIKCFGVLYILLDLLWFARSVEIIPDRVVQFEPFICENAAVCATSKPSRSFAARSKIACTVECQNHRESCFGVNFLPMNKTCEIFAGNPTDVSQNVTGCQYIQKKSEKNVLCYEFGYQSATLVHSFTGSTPALATAQLSGELFVARAYSPQLYVYDTTTFQLLRQLTFSGLGASVFGLVTDAKNNYLYIADRDNNKVHRVNRTGNITSTLKWNLPGSPYALSLTSDGNILVGFYGSNTIREYTSVGSLVRSVTDSNQLYQAVEVNDGTWAYSRRAGSANGIALASTNGTVLKSFGSTAGSGLKQMNGPRGIDIDGNGYILVADYGNNRILVVDPSLTVARQLILPANIALQTPICITLDRERSRVYIGEDSGQLRVLVFDIN